MIIWDKRNGYSYKDEANGKHYSVYEAKCYEGECTSDIVIIWDDERNCVANHVYGATFLHENIEELNNTIKFYVDEYETKKKANVAKVAHKHGFSSAGVKAFIDQASADFFAEMEKPYDEQHLENYDIVVSCGKHKIGVPLGAEEWNEIEAWLNYCLEVNL
jgi:hypothetical protein